MRAMTTALWDHRNFHRHFSVCVYAGACVLYPCVRTIRSEQGINPLAIPKAKRDLNIMPYEEMLMR